MKLFRMQAGSDVDPNYNPIRCIPVVVTGDQGCVYIDVIPSLDNGDDDLGGAAGGGRMAATTGGIQAQLLAIQSSNAQICRKLQEVQTNQMADRISISKNFTLVHANIRRIAVQPGVRSFRGTLAGGNDDTNLRAASAADQPVAIARLQPSLSPNPKNLYELWQEYEVGIGGRKAAKLFSQWERGGKNKHKYCRRNVIWKIVDNIVRGRGQMTADVVIDQIYAIYGQQTCVTNIINAIKDDIQRGRLNPNLSVKSTCSSDRIEAYRSDLLPPSHSTCPISIFSRGNSGISSKRHMILIEHDESYLQLYIIKYRRICLNLHFRIQNKIIMTPPNFPYIVHVHGS
jgi:hypothetical protein